MPHLNPLEECRTICASDTGLRKLEKILGGRYEKMLGDPPQYLVKGAPEIPQDSPVMSPSLELVLHSSKWLRCGLPN